jgi:hypothetical protein
MNVSMTRMTWLMMDTLAEEALLPCGPRRAAAVLPGGLYFCLSLCASSVGLKARATRDRRVRGTCIGSCARERPKKRRKGRVKAKGVMVERREEKRYK